MRNDCATNIKEDQSNAIKATKKTDPVTKEVTYSSKYYGMFWLTDENARVDFDPCWQQHERARRVSDWLVAY